MRLKTVTCCLAGLFTSLLLVQGLRLQTEARRQAAYVAAYHGQTQVLAALLDQGVRATSRVRAEDSLMWRYHQTFEPQNSKVFGRSLIGAAAGGGHLDTVELLLRNGASVNQADGDGMTPLFYAAMADDESMLHFLLANGADPFAINKVGDYAGSTDAKVIRLLHETRADWRRRGLPSNRHRIQAGPA